MQGRTGDYTQHETDAAKTVMSKEPFLPSLVNTTYDN